MLEASFPPSAPREVQPSVLSPQLTALCVLTLAQEHFFLFPALPLCYPREASGWQQENFCDLCLSNFHVHTNHLGIFFKYIF